MEDDISSAEALRRILTRLGWDVKVAPTVATGLSGLQNQPDAVILDLMLPDGDGSLVLERIRQMNLPTKVAVTTGMSDPNRLARLNALRPDSVLRKPVDLNALIAAIEPVH